VERGTGRVVKEKGERKGVGVKRSGEGRVRRGEEREGMEILIGNCKC